MLCHLKEEFISCMKILRMWIVMTILIHMKLQEFLLFHYVNKSSYLIITNTVYIGLKIRIMLYSTIIFLHQWAKSKTLLSDTVYDILHLHFFWVKFQPLLNLYTLIIYDTKKSKQNALVLVFTDIFQNILLRKHYLKICVSWAIWENDILF